LLKTFNNLLVRSGVIKFISNKLFIF